MHSHSGTTEKKRSVLLRQLVLAIAATVLIVFLCRNIYRDSEKRITLSFTVQYANQINNHWQIFYRSADGREKLNMLPPVYLRTGKAIAQTVSFPCGKLKSIRFDFGSNPGKIEMSRIVLQGKQRITLKDMTGPRVNQIQDLKLSSDGINGFSAKNDPFITFQLKNPLTGGRNWDYWALAIIVFSTFITVLAATRLLPTQTNRGIFAADLILVVLFLTALFIPVCHIDDRQVSVTEKRRLAPFRPLISSNMQVNYQFGKNFEAWFDDRFFGRSVLLDLNAFLFLKTKSPLQPYGNVFSGFDDWYFYSRENALRNYHNLDLFSDQELARAAENLNRIQQICRKKHKKLYLVIVPDKHKVYGEYFPGAPKLRPDSRSRARQLEKYLSANTGICVINLLDILIANKKRGLLYWKNSTHWNEMGAYTAYLAIMKQLEKDFPGIPPCRIQTVKPRKATVRGDLNALSNGDLIPDDTLYPLPHFRIIYKTVGDSVGKAFGTSRLVNPQGKYNLLIIRDSFASSLLPYLGNSFRSVSALWSGYTLTPGKMKAFEEADIVMFECVDRLLPSLLRGISATRVNLEQGVR